LRLHPWLGPWSLSADAKHVIGGHLFVRCAFSQQVGHTDSQRLRQGWEMLDVHGTLAPFDHREIGITEACQGVTLLK
jgi:hypothetical protein